MRVVVDTNVLISAFRSRRGASFALLDAAARGRFVMLATPPIYFEYEAVLKRAEHRLVHGLSDEDVDRALRGLAAIVEPVDVHFAWRPQLMDPGDEMVLEAAINGRAFYIATHNIKDFARASERFEIKIAKPGVVLSALGKKEAAS